MDESQFVQGFLTDEDLQEFIAIYKKQFRRELSFAEARAIAQPLIELYAQLARPLPSERSVGKLSTDKENKAFQPGQSSIPPTSPKRKVGT